MSVIAAETVVVCPTAIGVAAAVTTTLAIGTSETTTVPCPVFASLVAVIVALPESTAVTKPLFGSTVATDVLFDDQETARPESTFPCASFNVTVNGAVTSPTVSGALDGASATDATGTSVTLTVADPLFPSLVAVIVALPESTAVMRPVEGLTVATDVLFDDQEIARPVSTLPCASLSVTVKGADGDDPVTSAAVDGASVTDETGTSVTLTVAEPVFPSLVAVIVALPESTAVMRPVEGLTVATDVLLDDQEIARPVST